MDALPALASKQRFYQPAIFCGVLGEGLEEAKWLRGFDSKVLHGAVQVVEAAGW